MTLPFLYTQRNLWISLLGHFPWHINKTLHTPRKAPSIVPGTVINVQQLLAAIVPHHCVETIRFVCFALSLAPENKFFIDGDQIFISLFLMLYPLPGK